MNLQGGYRKFAATYDNWRLKGSYIAKKVLNDRTFNLRIFKMIIKRMKDGKEGSCKSKQESMKVDGFQIVLVEHGKEKIILSLHM